MYTRRKACFPTPAIRMLVSWLSPQCDNILGVHAWICTYTYIKIMKKHAVRQITDSRRICGERLDSHVPHPYMHKNYIYSIIYGIFPIYNGGNLCMWRILRHGESSFIYTLSHSLCSILQAIVYHFVTMIHKLKEEFVRSGFSPTELYCRSDF